MRAIINILQLMYKEQLLRINKIYLGTIEWNQLQKAVKESLCLSYNFPLQTEDLLGKNTIKYMGIEFEHLPEIWGFEIITERIK